jgi:hypothetical protein
VMNLSSLLSFNALAEGTANFLINDCDSSTLESKKFWEKKVEDLQYGMSWTNFYLKIVRHESEIYCPPANIVLTGGQIIDMLRRNIQERQQIGSEPFGLAILSMLTTTFPCP